MQALNVLAAQAIVGTERQAPALPQVPGALGETLAALDQTDPAAALLRAAGLLAVCALAGHRPESASLAVPAPCPPDTLPHGGESGLASLLGTVIEQGPLRVHAEALRLLAGACLPYRILPEALDLGRQNRVLRAWLLPVLGQRGQWLARQNPDWAYATGAAKDGSPEGTWETGSLDQRLLYLRQLRQTDPAQGRALLVSALPECGAKERAALVAVLETGLYADDEDLLEGLLKDRGKEVRQAAAALLARLPQSRFVARMAGRVSACLRHERKLFRQVLTLAAPEAFGADWKADTLEESKPQHEKLGLRAWWLYQLTGFLPLSWWEDATGLKPAELLGWAKGGEWQDALWRGWLDRQSQTPDPVWAEAFLSHLPAPRLAADPFTLALALPSQQRERHWLDSLRQAPSAGLGGVLRQLPLSLPADAPCVSADFARRVFALVGAYWQGAETAKDYHLRDALSELAALLPLEVFTEARALWESMPAHVPSYGAACNRFPAILELRERLHSHPLLKEAKP